MSASYQLNKKIKKACKRGSMKRANALIKWYPERTVMLAKTMKNWVSHV